MAIFVNPQTGATSTTQADGFVNLDTYNPGSAKVATQAVNTVAPAPVAPVATNTAPTATPKVTPAPTVTPSTPVVTQPVSGVTPVFNKAQIGEDLKKTLAVAGVGTKVANDAFKDAAFRYAYGRNANDTDKANTKGWTVDQLSNSLKLGDLAPAHGITLGEVPAGEAGKVGGEVAPEAPSIDPVTDAINKLIAGKQAGMGQNVDVNKYLTEKTAASTAVEVARQGIADKQLIDAEALKTIEGRPIPMTMINRQKEGYSADQYITDLKMTQDYNNKLILSKMADGNFLQAQQINKDIANDNYEIAKLQIDKARNEQNISDKEAARLDKENDFQREMSLEGYIYLSGPSQLKGLTEDQIYRDPVSGKIYKKPEGANVDAQLVQGAGGHSLLINSKTGQIIKDYGLSSAPKDNSASISEQLAAADKGYKIDDKGNIVSNSATTVTSPSGHTYDNSNYAADPVAHTNAINNTIASMGQFKSQDDLTDYLNNKQSNIGSTEIVNAASEYGVGWEELTAYLQHESSLGNSNVASKNNNPGGITWSQSYQNSHPGVSKGTARPASEGGNYVKFATMQDGVNMVAEQLQRRQIDNAPASTGDAINQPSEIDPQSSSILSQTGLSTMAFSYLTQGTPALTRLTAGQRASIVNESQKFLNSKGVDLSTFQSKYKAYNETVESNIKRFNNTMVAEGELSGTLDLLMTAASDADFSKLKVENVGKLLIGEQVNDENVTRYAFHLNSLRNELALYNAATKGNSQSDDADRLDANRVIKEGIAAGSLEGFRKSLTNAVEKMDTILGASVDRANKQVWDLFGVGGRYKSVLEGKTNSTNSNVTSGKTSSGLSYTVTY